MVQRLKVTTACCIFLSLIGGCSTLPRNEAALTVYTQPPGAMLYEGDTAWGMAPQKRTYFGNANLTTARTNPITAIWASGAQITKTVTVTMGRSDQYVVLSRPPDAPGLDKDLAYAAQLRQQQIERQQAAAEQQAASQRQTAADFQAAGNGLQGAGSAPNMFNIDPLAYEKAQLRARKLACMNDCVGKGYMYQYCQSRCGYQN